ncbi:unnamed protein product, partial [Symbiodinium sp. CCMP2456]
MELSTSVDTDYADALGLFYEDVPPQPAMAVAMGNNELQEQFFHANAEDLGMTFSILRHLRDQFKVNVLAPEYPGYGMLSHREPSEQALNEVALTVL